MPEKEPNSFRRAANQNTPDEWRWQALLTLVSLLILFATLGSAALFEPDEGRNSEKAREILVLNDWVTPHQNFLPTLDKPMFFYWLVALSFKLFGLSEWAARLPSTLAALGCLCLVYRFARQQWGLWEALWSCLILVSCTQFMIFSRLVIFDMTLTFFISWALFSFFRIAESQANAPKRGDIISFYVAMAFGTLIKGPIALIAPGMVVLVFLVFSRKWSLLKCINLPLGALLYVAIVIPWYAAAEIRNPGYLRYFLWDEHFVRYLTPRFGRSKSWYYFFMVIAVGFLPWTFTLAAAIKRIWQDKSQPATLFLIIWVVLPFVFFSASNSKLPHYILPIYPAMALLVGRVIVTSSSEPDRPGRWFSFWSPWTFVLSCMVYLLIGVVEPRLVAAEIRDGITANAALIIAATFLLLLIGVTPWFGRLQESWRSHSLPFFSTAVGMAIFVVLMTQVIASASFNRLSKPLAQAAAAHFRGQLVFYDTYLESLPFYLRIERPAWLVQAPQRTSIMASNYLAARRPPPAAGYGPVLLSFEEFAERWKRDKAGLLVLVRERNLPRLIQEIGSVPTEVARFAEYRVIMNSQFAAP